MSNLKQEKTILGFEEFSSLCLFNGINVSYDSNRVDLFLFLLKCTSLLVSYSKEKLETQKKVKVTGFLL